MKFIQEQEQCTQHHIFLCKALQSKLESNEMVDYKITDEDIYSNPQKQKVITTVFAKLLAIRENMMNQAQRNPSTSQGVLKISDNLQVSSVYYSSGNQ